MPLVGYLDGAVAGRLRDLLAAFRQGLKDTDYVEGENGGSNTAGRKIKLIDCLRWRPSWFVEGSRDRRDEAQQRVGGQGGNVDDPDRLGDREDPIRLGLVVSLNRPGGNATGVNILVTELGSKQLGLLHELIPGTAAFAYLSNPKIPSGTRE